MGAALGVTVEGIKGQFRMVYEEALGGMWWPTLAMKFASSNDQEIYKWLGMSPSMRKWVDGRQAKGLRGSGVTIVNEPYEATLSIFKEELRRDKTGQIRLRISEMARKAAEHPQKLLSALMVAGLTEEGYDGQFFFDTDHSEGDSGVQSNKLDSADYPTLDVVDKEYPTPDEMAKAIMSCIQHFYTYLDDKGDPINGEAQQFSVMVPVKGTLYSSALEAVRANMLSTGASVRDNTLPKVFNVSVVPNPRLTWTDQFIVHRTDGSAKPYILQEELPVSEDARLDDSTEAFLNRRYLFGVEWNGGVGFGFWQHAIHATLSTIT